MSVGAPVVSSDHECMREILGDSAWYMDARNVDNIASSLLEFLELNEGRDEYIEKGYRQAEKYNWTRMAKDTLAQYQNRN
jgi:glycosyltransferase involved in cell wall biosynthesis